MPSPLTASARQWIDATDDFQGEDRRTPNGRERDKVLQTFAEGTEDHTSIVEALGILRGVRARIDRWMVPEDASSEVQRPAEGDNGTISGAAAAFITRGQWEAARSAGALIVFYESEDDRVGKVFERPTSVDETNETIHGEVDHAQIIRLPAGLTLSRRIPPHDHVDYKEREQGVNGKKLGFGDEKEGLINADAMVMMVHNGKAWMKEGQVLPLMELSASPSAEVFHYGAELFEGIGCERNEDGEICIFDLEGHYERLSHGARRFKFPPLPPFDIFKKMILDLVDANERFIPEAGMGRLYLRPNLIDIGPKLKVGHSHTQALIFTASPIGNAGSYFGSLTQAKVAAVPTNRVRAVAGQGGDTKAGGNYAVTIEAIEAAHALGLEGGVAYLNQVTQARHFPRLRDHESKRNFAGAVGRWAVDKLRKRHALGKAEFKEMNASNLIAFEELEGGRWKIVTPRLDEGDILAGRTRELVLYLAKEFGWEVEEGVLTWKDVEAGKYKFLAGSGTGAYLRPFMEFNAWNWVRVKNWDCPKMRRMSCWVGMKQCRLHTEKSMSGGPWGRVFCSWEESQLQKNFAHLPSAC